LEWAPFQLKPGVDEAALLAASDALQRDFLGRQPGFIRRELLKGKGGQWVDAVYWSSQADFERASRLVMESPVCLQYFELMVPGDPNDPHGGISHFELVRSFG
jgi:hypothetical protein